MRILAVTFSSSQAYLRGSLSSSSEGFYLDNFMYSSAQPVNLHARFGLLHLSGTRMLKSVSLALAVTGTSLVIKINPCNIADKYLK